MGNRFVNRRTGFDETDRQLAEAEAELDNAARQQAGEEPEPESTPLMEWAEAELENAARQQAASEEGGAVEEAGEFDPSDHTVDEVNTYLDANPDDSDRVLKLEKKGKARVGILGD